MDNSSNIGVLICFIYETSKFYGSFGTRRKAVLLFIFLLLMLFHVHGRRHYRGSDLRDKLDRRRSPPRSYSPKRDVRRRHESYGDSPRSLGRNGKRRKKQQGDGHSDYSGSVRFSEGTEDKVKDLRRASAESQDFHDEQLRKLESEISLLDEHKHRLEDYLDERIKETDILNTTIQELELRLRQEEEESRRIFSKIKKFTKVYSRQLRVEDELKRSRAELQRMREQLMLDSSRLADEEDPGINTSDEEIAGDNLRSQRNEIASNASLSKKRSRVNDEVDELTLQAANSSKGEVTLAGKSRMENLSRWNPVSNTTNSKKAETNANEKHVSRSVIDEYNSKAPKHVSSDMAVLSKSRVSESGVLFPSTSMAARASNDLVDAIEAEDKVDMLTTPSGTEHEVGSKVSILPFPPPPPPPIPENAYTEHKGNDEIVDIDGTEEELAEVDIV